MVGTGLLAECVVNISEGRRAAVIDEAASAGADLVLDVHSDAVHNRTVLTLGGPLEPVEDAARRVVRVAVARIDLRRHTGVHPRFGAVDVVPFVAPGSDWGAPPPDVVVGARDRLARWAGAELELPCFLYGPERSLPDVRRTAFVSLPPDTGPDQAHPTAGACAVGARPVLVAYNLWITAGCGSPGDGSPGDGSPGDGSPGDGSPGDGSRSAVLSVARVLATRLRGPDLRALGFARPDGAQVSINIIGPAARPLAALYDAVAAGAVARGCRVHRAELVGLVPRAVLSQANRERWAELDLDEDRTIEARMAAHGHELRDPPR